MFTYVYTFSPMFTPVHSCLPVFGIFEFCVISIIIIITLQDQ